MNPVDSVHFKSCNRIFRSVDLRFSVSLSLTLSDTSEIGSWADLCHTKVFATFLKSRVCDLGAGQCQPHSSGNRAPAENDEEMEF